jgi:ribonucleoside-triphosphate reductase (formate)
VFVIVKIHTQNGFIEEFSKEKIIAAIEKDTEFLKNHYSKVNIISKDDIKKVANSVKRLVDKMELSDEEILSSDTIRGLVVTELRKLGEIELANVAEIVGPRLTDILKIWGVNGDTVHDNANQDAENQETMHKHIADVVSSKAMLRMLPENIVKSHLSGDIHIHDREYFFTRQFCFDSDLRYILYYGLYPDGKGISLPVARAARSAEVAFLHAAKTLGSSQCNCAGGQGYQSFNIFIAPYLEGKSYKEIKQLAQMFVFEMGQMVVARGAQPVFSSIQLWPGCPTIWKDKPVVYKGQVWDGRKCYEENIHGVCYPTNEGKTYGKYEREIRLLFKAFLEVFYSGDSLGRPFRFPKPEIVISKEFLEGDLYKKSLNGPWDEPDEDGTQVAEILAPSYYELYRMAFKLALHNGAPYFESQYHVENPLNSIQCMQCCSYGFQSDASSDKEFYNKLNFIDGAHFDNLGSMQVISLNLPRAAYIAEQRLYNGFGIGDHFQISLQILKDLIDQCVQTFLIKRDSLKKQASPFMRQTPVDPNNSTKHAPSYGNLEKLSYVIGLVGLNEYVQAMTRKQLHESKEALDLGLKLVAALNLYCGKVGHESGLQIALARTPAETTAQRFAVSDLINYPEYARKYVKGNLKVAEEKLEQGIKDLPIEYSNGTHCAVGAPISLQKKAEVEGEFFRILKGGNIFHIFLADISPFLTLETTVNEKAERVPKEITEQDIDDVMKFGLNITKNTPITYFAFSKDTTVCLDCNAISNGILRKCPKCLSEKLDYIARITGYMSSVSGWNEAKKQELKDRYRYNTKQVG